MKKATTSKIKFNFFGNELNATLWETKSHSRVYLDKNELLAEFGINFEEFDALELGAKKTESEKEMLKLGVTLCSKDFYFDNKTGQWSDLAQIKLDEAGFINLKAEAQAKKDELLTEQTEKFNEIVNKVGKERAEELLEDSFPRSSRKNMQSFLNGEASAKVDFFNDFYDYAKQL